MSKCEMSKLVGAGRQCQVPRLAGRLFRLAGPLGRTEETGPGKGVRWLGGQWDGRVNVNHKLASKTTDAGRGEMRKVVGVIRAILYWKNRRGSSRHSGQEIIPN